MLSSTTPTYVLSKEIVAIAPELIKQVEFSEEVDLAIEVPPPTFIFSESESATHPVSMQVVFGKYSKSLTSSPVISEVLATDPIATSYNDNVVTTISEAAAAAYTEDIVKTYSTLVNTSSNIFSTGSSVYVGVVPNRVVNTVRKHKHRKYKNFSLRGI